MKLIERNMFIMVMNAKQAEPNISKIGRVLSLHFTGVNVLRLKE
jgi:hypothetical protein